MPKHNETNDERMLEQFLAYLQVERGLSRNTVSSYASDLRQFMTFLSVTAKTTLLAVTRDDVGKFS